MLQANGECMLCNEWDHRTQAASANRRQRLARALGGERALDFTAESFLVTDDNRAAFEAAAFFVPKTANLYLHGPCGTGKTHLACMIAREAIHRNESAEYLQPGRLLRGIRGKTGDEEQTEIDRLAALDLLVLDDLGAEKDTEYAVQILYEVIDARVMNYRNGLVVTSNLALPDLAKKLGDDRLPSRLAGMCRIIEIGGRDWRLASF